MTADTYPGRHVGERSKHDPRLVAAGFIACQVCRYEGKHAHAGAELNRIIATAAEAAERGRLRREVEDRTAAREGPVIPVIHRDHDGTRGVVTELTTVRLVSVGPVLHPPWGGDS